VWLVTGMLPIPCLSKTVPFGIITLNFREPNELEGLNFDPEEMINDRAGATWNTVALQIANGTVTSYEDVLPSSLKSLKAPLDTLKTYTPPGRSKFAFDPCSAEGKLPVSSVTL